MTAQDFYAVCREHIPFVHRGARFHKETGSVTVDVHTKPGPVQSRLCDNLAQSLGRKGWNVDVWLEGGLIHIADRKEAGG
jgi:hypothetical protein